MLELVSVSIKDVIQDCLEHWMGAVGQMFPELCTFSYMAIFKSKRNDQTPDSPQIRIFTLKPEWLSSFITFCMKRNNIAVLHFTVPIYFKMDICDLCVLLTKI